MEGNHGGDVHGVDVSWLHHSNKIDAAATKDTAKPIEPGQVAANAAPRVAQANGYREGKTNGDSTNEPESHLHRPHLLHWHSEDTRGTPPSSPSTTLSPAAKDAKSRGSQELRRRGSWITNISSKFSSSSQQSPQPTPTKSSPAEAKEQPTQAVANGSPAAKENKKADNTTPAPSSPKGGGPSFLQSALRRLSSSTGTGGGKVSGNGGQCPRKVMNVDPYRDRCQIDHLQPAKLRRVSFSVDVEIAAPPRYDSIEDDSTPVPIPASPGRRPSLTQLEKVADAKKAREKNAKIKEKAEGEALKNPETLAEVKEESKDANEVDSKVAQESTDSVEEQQAGVEEKAPITKKKEKKKRSEEERKERKERKRQAAVANGSIPIEISLDHSSSSEPSSPGNAPPKSQDKPTTDPLRIYRRCCQLRESPVLKRIADQLSTTSAEDPYSDCTVTSIDLTGLKIPLSDLITLGDYLAVVPVRKLVLEDCDLSDEGVRVILAGLLSVKTPEQAKFNRHLSKQARDTDAKTERLGVIEKLCLKDNPSITQEGWRHIALFLNMSRSLKAIDLSGIKFPSKNDPPPKHHHHIHKQHTDPRSSTNIAETFEKCLAERLAGDRLEELVMAKCNLETSMIESIVRAIIACGVKRLGLAYNDLTKESLQAISNYLLTGQCEGLDLGGNRLVDHIGLLTQSMKDPEHKLFALSLADCDLTPAALKVLLRALVKLPNFKFIDLSHNKGLFESQPNATSLLRKYLPQMATLKRIHLNDVAMDSEQCIALAEILPEIPYLAHIGVVENPKLTALASANDEAMQEEACAYYASLMVATRVSKSIVSWDIDMPTAQASELVKALGKQLLAYALRNMERGPSGAALDAAENREESIKDVPDILLHLVGHVDGFPENHDGDEPAPNEDYIVSGTGVVKALGICLGNKVADGRKSSRTVSRDGTPHNVDSGVNTPKQLAQDAEQYKAKDMSKDLLSSARKIRARLQLALAKEAKGSDEMTYKRLQFLDATLTRIIERFEEEYPDCRQEPAKTSTEEQSSESGSLESSSMFSNPFQKPDSSVEAAEQDEDEDPKRRRLSRHGSDVSLASRHLAMEEGQMHRFGQKVRRSVLLPPTFDYHHNGGIEDEAEHLKLFRAKLDSLTGSEIKERVSKEGIDKVIADMGTNAQELLELEKQDPEGFQKLVEAQENAQATMPRD